MIECKFNKGDYLTYHGGRNFAVYDRTDKKGYMHFKYYYSWFFEKVLTDYTMIVNYQDNFKPISEDEKLKFNEILDLFKKGEKYV